MKNSIVIILALLFAVVETATAQFIIPSSKPERPKENIRYIVIYRTWTQYLKSSGGSSNIEYDWKSEISAFETFDAMNDWLNGKDWTGKPKAAITEEQLIGAYELSDARKLEMTFVKEQKSQPKRVEIQEEQWEETRWKIKAKN